MNLACHPVSSHPQTTLTAAMQAITGGREIWGFPKHPDLARITHRYTTDADGERAAVEFECHHHDKLAIKMRCTLPEKDAPAGPFPLTIPVDVPMTAPDACIGSPRLGGTHKGHNGANQMLYATSLKCTQVEPTLLHPTASNPIPHQPKHVPSPYHRIPPHSTIDHHSIPIPIPAHPIPSHSIPFHPHSVPSPSRPFPPPCHPKPAHPKPAHPPSVTTSHEIQPLPPPFLPIPPHPTSLQPSPAQPIPPRPTLPHPAPVYPTQPQPASSHGRRWWARGTRRRTHCNLETTSTTHRSGGGTSSRRLRSVSCPPLERTANQPTHPPPRTHFPPPLPLTLDLFMCRLS